jgi:hypothetical protein
MEYDWESFEVNGRSYRARIVADCDSSDPWQNSDGHGPVSGYVMRAKRPGEITLWKDTRGAIYYDWQAAVAQAKAESWDSFPYGPPGETRGQKAVRAVKADFEYLRRYCIGQWQYVGVCVQCVETGEETALWGIESDSGEYLWQVALDLSGELK